MMNIEAKAANYFDEVIAPLAFKQAAEVITVHGDPTEKEFEEFIEGQMQGLRAERATLLKELRSFLERDGATLQ